MSRNIYSEEFNNFIKEKAKDYTKSELITLSKELFGYDISKCSMGQLLWRRKVKSKDYKYSMSRNMGNRIPIGTEYIKQDGMTLIKVDKDKWEYKQRKIYEDYYNVKLPKTTYVIFLDHDRNNFDINNLKAVSARESGLMANLKLFFTDKQTTKTGLIIAKTIIKAGDKEVQYERTNIRRINKTINKTGHGR